MVIRAINGTIRNTYHSLGGMRKAKEGIVSIDDLRRIANSLDPKITGKSKWSIHFEQNDRKGAPAKELLEKAVSEFMPPFMTNLYTDVWHEVYRGRGHETHYFDLEHGFEGERPFKKATVTYQQKTTLESQEPMAYPQKLAKSLKSSLGVFYLW